MTKTRNSGRAGGTDPVQEITDTLIRQLEAGTLPWRRPWAVAGGGAPLRSTGERYQGINAFLLGLKAILEGYSSPYWLTYKQAKELGAQVRKGARSSPVIYYGTAERKGREAGSLDDPETYRFLKAYRVFNAAQIEGLDAAFHPENAPALDQGAKTLSELQSKFEAMGAETRFGGDQACYIPDLDRIHMPDISRFETAHDFYATWAHEHGHFALNKDRVPHDLAGGRFGDAGYAEEEIVAEMAACLLGQRLGFALEPTESSAAYIGHWLKMLRQTPRFLFKAGGLAERVAAYLIDASETGSRNRRAA